MNKNVLISNQDFQIVKSYVNKSVEMYGNTYNFTEKSIGFQFLILEKLFDLQEDEIIESITDTIFQGKLGKDSNPDRGVDAIIINEETREIHLFNFKYSDKDFSELKLKNFEGNEINKILTFISDIYQKNESSFSGNKANAILCEKVKEVWRLIDSGIVFKYKIHFSSNLFTGFTTDEEHRLDTSLLIYKGEVSYDYILIQDIVDRLTQRTEKINSKFRALNTNFFDKADSGRRALIMRFLGLICCELYLMILM
jgi:hypothetical protein